MSDIRYWIARCMQATGEDDLGNDPDYYCVADDDYRLVLGIYLEPEDSIDAFADDTFADNSFWDDHSTFAVCEVEKFEPVQLSRIRFALFAEDDPKRLMGVADTVEHASAIADWLAGSGKDTFTIKLEKK